MQVMRQSESTVCAQINAKLTFITDRSWSGMLCVAAHALPRLAMRQRFDLYVLAGSLQEAGTGYPTGSFLNRGADTLLSAGPDGARLLVWQDPLATSALDRSLRPEDMHWSAGAAQGMAVAMLTQTDHRHMLVSWRPGTRVPFHHHARGEEIYVLTGELQDQAGCYPAGSWLRLGSGTGHAPFADTPTLILLRNGHLDTPASHIFRAPAPSHSKGIVHDLLNA